MSYSNDKAKEEFKTIEETRVLASLIWDELDSSREDEEVDLQAVLKKGIEEIKETGKKHI